MKTLAIAIIASFSIGSAFAQGAKQPEGIAKTAPAVTAPAAAPATAKKEDKKEAKKADTKSEAAPAAKADAPKK
jgi:hypothetical protein